MGEKTIFDDASIVFRKSPRSVIVGINGNRQIHAASNDRSDDSAGFPATCIPAENQLKLACGLAAGAEVPGECDDIPFLCSAHDETSEGRFRAT